MSWLVLPRTGKLARPDVYPIPIGTVSECYVAGSRLIGHRNESLNSWYPCTASGCAGRDLVGLECAGNVGVAVCPPIFVMVCQEP